jgi:hypothetical protein
MIEIADFPNSAAALIPFAGAPAQSQSPAERNAAGSSQIYGHQEDLLTRSRLQNFKRR